MRTTLFVVAISAVLFLTACGNKTDTHQQRVTKETHDYQLTEGLEGCRHFVVQFDYGYAQGIWRCPNSTTTASQGKSAPAVVIDGN